MKVFVEDKELQNSLNRLSHMDLKPALNKVAKDIETRAKMNCDKFSEPTGALKNSIKAEVTDNTVEVGSDLDYAMYVEYGTGLFANGGVGRPASVDHPIPWRYQGSDGEWHTTSGQKAQPFLTPAYNSEIDNINRYIREEIDLLW